MHTEYSRDQLCVSRLDIFWCNLLFWAARSPSNSQDCARHCTSSSSRATHFPCPICLPRPLAANGATSPPHPSLNLPHLWLLAAAANIPLNRCTNRFLRRACIPPHPEPSTFLLASAGYGSSLVVDLPASSGLDTTRHSILLLKSTYPRKFSFDLHIARANI